MEIKNLIPESELKKMKKDELIDFVQNMVKQVDEMIKEFNEHLKLRRTTNIITIILLFLVFINFAILIENLI